MTPKLTTAAKFINHKTMTSIELYSIAAADEEETDEDGEIIEEEENNELIIA